MASHMERLHIDNFQQIYGLLDLWPLKKNYGHSKGANKPGIQASNNVLWRIEIVVKGRDLRR